MDFEGAKVMAIFGIYASFNVWPKNKILENLNKRLGTWKYPGKEKEKYRHKPPILGFQNVSFQRWKFA